MDYNGVIYLTNFIKNEVDGRADKLASIYYKAVRESDSYKELNSLRQRVVFFDNGVGGTLYNECNYLMQAIAKEPENGQELLVRMKNLSKDILAEEARSLKVLDNFFRNLTAVKFADSSEGTSVGVLAKDVNERYGRMFNILASSIVHTLLVTGGTDAINGLRWNDKNSINVKLNILNNEMLPRLCDGDTPVILWRIVKVRDDRNISLCDYRYNIEYISYDDYRMYAGQMKPIKDNIYADVHILNSDDCGTVYAGMGNLVGGSAADCLARLSEGVLVKDGYFGAVTEEAAALCNGNPITDVPEIMSGGKMYVVSPNKACDLLNQYVNARQIIHRKKQGLCLICGRKLSEGLVCKGHFQTRERVYY